MPASIALTFGRPPELANMTAREYPDMLRARVEAAEAETEAKRRATGGRVLGKQAVLDQDWRDSPTSHEPRLEPDPRVAAKSKWSRIAALQRSKEFGNVYRTAFEAFRAGVKNVLFPVGTFWLRRFAAATCEPWPAEVAAAPARESSAETASDWSVSRESGSRPLRGYQVRCRTTRAKQP
jgi:putative transposase